MKECDCPIDAVASIVGSRWIIVLLRDLYLGKTRFKEFLQANPTLSNKVLSKKLKELEEHGLIEKQVSGPKQVHYSLTSQGKKLRGVLRELVRFGKSYCKSTQDYKELLKRLE